MRFLLTSFLIALGLLGSQGGPSPAPRTVVAAAKAPPGVRSCLQTSELLRFETPVLMADFTTDYKGSPPDRNFNMAKAAKSLCRQVIHPGEIFSFNQRVGEAGRQNGYKISRVFVGDRIVEDYGGGVCQVVSTLYNAVLRANLTVVESHLHGLTVPYLPPGEDATIAYGALDFQFRNDSPGDVLIDARGEGQQVHVAVFGQVGGAEVSFRHKILGTAPRPVIRIRDKSLPPGAEKVIFPGQTGVTVETWVTQKGDGPERTTHRGVHIYRASPRIIHVGLALG